MPNKKPKLTPDQIRKQNYLRTWGIKDGPHNPDLRNIIRNAVYEADAEKKKVTTPSKKIDVDSITASRLRYERLMRGDDD